MIEVETGSTVTLEAGLNTGASAAGLFVHAVVKTTGGTPIAGSPFAMADLGDGTYQVTFTAPATGEYKAYVTAFTDPGFTIPAAFDQNVPEHIRVFPKIEDQVWDALKAAHLGAGSFGEAVVAAAGHAGLHCRLDGGAGFAGASHNANNNLTGARLRIFPTKAAAVAATDGAADGADGELLRLFWDSSVYSAGSTTPSPEVLASFLRTQA